MTPRFLPVVAGVLLSAVLSTPAAAAVTFRQAGASASIAVDPADYPVVSLAAGLLADDVQRVTGNRPEVTATPTAEAVIAGTLGHSRLIDQLVSRHAIDTVTLEKLNGAWETTLCVEVANPLPGVERAVVIIGSDRRATAYGLLGISERIGVSPWYWWADAATAHRDRVEVGSSDPALQAPAVRYRGLFINDEDWGLNPWASKTFDPAYGNIGPKTYAHVFELMLRLRLNLIWPAMHPVSREFGSDPENVALADRYGIVAGASHCEPMLFNNVHWDETQKGKWNYSTNRDAIHRIWEKTATERGSDEAVWTLGIRGIHDAGMETPPTQMDGKRAILNQVIADQRALLDQHVSRQWGPVAQCFVPYKEVLPVYDAGIHVPDDVTLVWVDDNFGYIRRVANPQERKRSGGSGLYWHLSYYGGPHSYTWINTTAPALIWEEFHKAWENEVRSLWIINVGDIKPMELGIDYFARLAWNPDGPARGAQPEFLRAFAARTFGEATAAPMADLLGAYYRLGTVHKPELMDRAWATALPASRATELTGAYADLLSREKAVRSIIPPAELDAYVEMVGFPAQVLGETGLIFMADRAEQEGAQRQAQEALIASLRDRLEQQVVAFNTQIAGGKWNRMMPGLETGKELMKWSSQVRWPWGEPATPPSGRPPRDPNEPAGGQAWRDAASGIADSPAGQARWSEIPGLGGTGKAVIVTPASLGSAWAAGDPSAPALTYRFQTQGPVADIYIEYLPTFRLYPGMKLRVALSVDHGAPLVVEVPGSSGAENEQGAVRQFAVQDNFVRSRTSVDGLAAGQHTLEIRPMDPGIAIDRVSVP